MSSGFAETDAAGTYQVSKLPSGMYYAYTRNDLGFIDEIYANVPCGTTCAPDTIRSSGTPIAVKAGVTAPNKVFALALGGVCPAWFAIA